MKKYACIAIFVIFFSCSSKKANSPFTFTESEQGVNLTENGDPVLFYQKAPKSLTGEYISNNYIHPLYNLNGDTLTEEFPSDHPYHRGIFWAWHQIFVDGESIGDGWILENIKQEVVDMNVNAQNELAQLELEVNWKSPLYKDGKSFIKEHTTVTVHPREKNIRKIDFSISLKALVPDVEIGGSDDVKGYGGFCARIKLPKDITFTSTEGEVTPKTQQIEAGAWMDFTSAQFDSGDDISGIAILCHPKTPNYPAPWILRSRTSMQNVVYPGRELTPVAMEKPTILYYRLIIHNGDTQSINLDQLQAEYEQVNVINM